MTKSYKINKCKGCGKEVVLYLKETRVIVSKSGMKTKPIYEELVGQKHYCLLN